MKKIITCGVILFGIIFALALMMFLKGIDKDISNKDQVISELQYEQYLNGLIIDSLNTIVVKKQFEKDSVISVNKAFINKLSYKIKGYEDYIQSIPELSQTQCQDSLIKYYDTNYDSLLSCKEYETALEYEKCKIEKDTLLYTIKSKDAEILFNKVEIGVLKTDTSLLSKNTVLEKSKTELFKKDLEKANKNIFWYKIGIYTTSGLVILALIL